MVFLQSDAQDTFLFVFLQLLFEDGIHFFGKPVTTIAE